MTKHEVFFPRKRTNDDDDNANSFSVNQLIASTLRSETDSLKSHLNK